MLPAGKNLILFFSILFMSSGVFAHEWMAPKKEAEIKNPLGKDEQIMRLGRDIYSQFCIDCHGEDAKGMDPETIGFDRRPPDLQKTLKSHSDGDIFWKIKTGRKNMPSFKEDLEEREIWSVIHYIHSLRVK